MIRVRPFLALAASALVLDAGCGSAAFRCQVDHDCDGTDLCRVSTGECVPVSAAECRQDADCVDSRLACWDLACVSRCRTTLDCGDAARTCADGRCVPRGSTVDATP